MTENYKRIRCEDDELLAAHIQNCRHRVNCENDVWDFDEHKHCQQWRRHAIPVMPCKHLLTVTVINRWHKFMEEIHRACVSLIAFLFSSRIFAHYTASKFVQLFYADSSNPCSSWARIRVESWSLENLLSFCANWALQKLLSCRSQRSLYTFYF